MSQSARSSLLPGETPFVCVFFYRSRSLRWTCWSPPRSAGVTGGSQSGRWLVWPILAALRHQRILYARFTSFCFLSACANLLLEDDEMSGFDFMLQTSRFLAGTGLISTMWTLKKKLAITRRGFPCLSLSGASFAPHPQVVHRVISRERALLIRFLIPWIHCNCLDGTKWDGSFSVRVSASRI